MCTLRGPAVQRGFSAAEYLPVGRGIGGATGIGPDEKEIGIRLCFIRLGLGGRGGHWAGEWGSTGAGFAEEEGESEDSAEFGAEFVGCAGVD
jgi:hypothetical protein